MHPLCVPRSKLREGFNAYVMLLWIWKKCLRLRLIFSPFPKSNPHLIASLTPWHALLWKPCWGNHNMVSVLWRAQPPENIHFTHRNEKAVVPVCTWRWSKGLWEEQCLSSFSQQSPFWTSSCLSTISLCGHLQNRTGDGLCVADLSDRKRPPHKEGSVILCCGEKGLGEMEGHSNIMGECFWGIEVRPIFGFCFPSTGEGYSPVILVTRFSWPRPCHHCVASDPSISQSTTPLSAKNPLCPAGSSTTLRKRMTEKEKQGCHAPMFIKGHQ